MSLAQLRDHPQAYPSTLQCPDFFFPQGEGRLEQVKDNNDVLLPDFFNTSKPLELSASVFESIKED